MKDPQRGPGARDVREIHNDARALSRGRGKGERPVASGVKKGDWRARREATTAVEACSREWGGLGLISAASPTWASWLCVLARHRTRYPCRVHRCAITAASTLGVHTQDTPVRSTDQPTKRPNDRTIDRPINREVHIACSVSPLPSESRFAKCFVSFVRQLPSPASCLFLPISMTVSAV